MAYAPPGYGPAQMSWFYNYFNTASYGQRWDADAVPLDMDRRIKEVAAFDADAANQLQNYRNSVRDNPWGSWQGFVNVEGDARSRNSVAQAQRAADEQTRLNQQAQAQYEAQQAAQQAAPPAPAPPPPTPQAARRPTGSSSPVTGALNAGPGAGGGRGASGTLLTGAMLKKNTLLGS